MADDTTARGTMPKREAAFQTSVKPPHHEHHAGSRRFEAVEHEQQVPVRQERLQSGVAG